MEDPASIELSGPDVNRRPLWVLYEVAGRDARQVTPTGITTRGGLVVSAPAAGVAWVGVGSYRYQLDGAAFVTTDSGRQWSPEIIPASFDPTPDGLVATSASTAWVLTGQGAGSRVLVTHDGGGRWSAFGTGKAPMGSDPRRCTPRGIGVVGSSVWVGAICEGPGPGYLAVSTGSSWSLVSTGVTAGPGEQVSTLPPGTPETGGLEASSGIAASYLALAAVSDTAGSGGLPAPRRGSGSVGGAPWTSISLLSLTAPAPLSTGAGGGWHVKVSSTYSGLVAGGSSVAGLVPYGVAPTPGGTLEAVVASRGTSDPAPWPAIATGGALAAGGLGGGAGDGSWRLERVDAPPGSLLQAVATSVAPAAIVTPDVVRDFVVGTTRSDPLLVESTGGGSSWSQVALRLPSTSSGLAGAGS